MRKLFTNQSWTFPLDGQGIDTFSAVLEEALEDSGLERQNRLRIRLSLEEALLRMRDHFGEEALAEAHIGARFGRPYIQIELEGDVFNPLSKTENELEDWSGSLLTSVGLSPQFSYSQGRNILRLTLPTHRMNLALKTLLMIFLGVVLGAIAVHLLPTENRVAVADLLYTQSYELWYRILMCISGPVIFFMLLTTLLNTGSISEQGGSRRYSILRYFLLSLLAAVTAVLLVLLVLPRTYRVEEVSPEHARGLLEYLISIVPENLFSPLVEVNTPQLLLMALVIGNVLFALGPRANAIAAFIRQCSMAGMFIAEWVSRLVPYVTGILICLDAARSRSWLGLLDGLWESLVVSFVLSVLYIAAMFLYVSLRKKVPLRLLWDKVKEPFWTTVKTGSLDASYGQAEQACTAKLGIEKQFAAVSIPYGLVLYMPINVIGTLCFTIGAANHYGVTVSVLWFLIATVLAIVLFVATPPVPGANLLAYIVIFAQLGIPASALIPAMVFEILFGPLASAGNQALLQMELILQADRIGLLDHELLQKELPSETTKRKLPR